MLHPKKVLDLSALRQTGVHAKMVLAAMLVAALALVGGAAASDVDRALGPISPFSDPEGLAKALVPVVREEPICLGVGGQGSNVLLSRSRRPSGVQTGIVFPTLVDNATPGRLRIELEALTHAGLIELATMEGFETYRLTELGHQFYDVGRRDFCVNGAELVTVLGVSERLPEIGAAADVAVHEIAELEEQGGSAETAGREAPPRAYVAYRYRFIQPSRWFHDAGLKRIYPALRNPDSAVAVAVLQQSKEGWYLVGTFPAGG